MGQFWGAVGGLGPYFLHALGVQVVMPTMSRSPTLCSTFKYFGPLAQGLPMKLPRGSKYPILQAFGPKYH